MDEDLEQAQLIKAFVKRGLEEALSLNPCAAPILPQDNRVYQPNRSEYCQRLTTTVPSDLT